MRRAYLLISAGLAAVLCLLVLLRADGSPKIHVTTAPVTAGTITRQVIASGTLNPSKKVDVSTQVSGTIQSVEVDFNSVVRGGQVLARLDPSVYQTQLQEAQGRLAQALADRSRARVLANDARAKLARAEPLARDELIPQTELEAAQVTVQQAAADVNARDAEIKAAQAAVNQAQINLSHTVIKSPIAGIVVSRNIDVGQTIAASYQSPVLFTIADLGRMELLAEIGEADVAGVQPGSRVQFELESAGRESFEGTVSEVRLQPVAGQPATATSGSPASAPAAAASAGTAPATPASPGSAPATASTGTAPRSTTSIAQDARSPTSSSASTTTASPPGGASGTTAAPGQSSAPAPRQSSGQPRTGVVTYTAVIDVDNSGRTLPPGSTAIVTVPGSRRRNVVRIPNNALTFRPSAEVLDAIDQEEPRLNRAEHPRAGGGASNRGARSTHVWRYEDGRFVPIEVQVGLSDDKWTELVDGPIRPRDRLVTSAAIAERAAATTSPATQSRRGQ
jgi:RND family efflux transporter MFP subunit